MKKIFVYIVAMTSLSVPAHGFVIAGDVSPTGIMNAIVHVTNVMERATQLAEKIGQGVRMIENQVKAFQQLHEKGFDGLGEFLNFQSGAFTEMSNFMGDVGSVISDMGIELPPIEIPGIELPDFNKLGEEINEQLTAAGNTISEVFDTVRSGMESKLADFLNNALGDSEMLAGFKQMSDVIGQLASKVGDVKGFVTNATKRMENVKELMKKARNAKSPIAQAQVLAQIVAVLTSQNTDEAQMKTNAETLKLNERKYVELAQEYLSSLAKKEIMRKSAIGDANPEERYEDDIFEYKQEIKQLWKNIVPVFGGRR